MVRQLTAVYEKHGEWYVAYIKEIPGVNTQGQTLDEARENLEDAFQMLVEPSGATSPAPLDGFPRANKHTTQPASGGKQCK